MLENNNYVENKNVRKKLIMTIALVLITVALGIGGVYAYFAATVTQDTTSGISISAVSGLKISFSNSSAISMPNALPGQSFTKTFSATLTNKKLAITTNYSIYIKATTNGFNEQTGKLTYTLKKNGEVVKNNIEITGTGPFSIYTTSITGNTDNDTVTDSYELTITYPNNETSVQKQGATFNGSVYFGVADADNKIDSESVQTANEITFNIDGVGEFTVDEGTTLGEWLESGVTSDLLALDPTVPNGCPSSGTAVEIQDGAQPWWSSYCFGFFVETNEICLVTSSLLDDYILSSGGSLRFCWTTCLTPETYIYVIEEDKKNKKKKILKKKLKDLKVGDKVVSINPETGLLDEDTVVYTDYLENKNYDEYDKWYFDDGTIIETVYRHRFYNIERQAFIYMDEWNIGDHAYNYEGKAIKLIKHENIKEKVRHCTLFTEKWNNYFANGCLSGNRNSNDIKIEM